MMLNLKEVDKQKILATNEICVNKCREAGEYLCVDCMQVLCAECEEKHNEKHKKCHYKKEGFRMKREFVEKLEKATNEEIKGQNNEVENVFKKIANMLKTLASELEIGVLKSLGEFKESYLGKVNKNTKKILENTKKSMEELYTQKKYLQLYFYCIEAKSIEGLDETKSPKRKVVSYKRLNENITKIKEMLTKRFGEIEEYIKKLDGSATLDQAKLISKKPAKKTQ